MSMLFHSELGIKAQRCQMKLETAEQSQTIQDYVKDELVLSIFTSEC